MKIKTNGGISVTDGPCKMWLQSSAVPLHKILVQHLLQLEMKQNLIFLLQNLIFFPANFIFFYNVQNFTFSPSNLIFFLSKDYISKVKNVIFPAFAISVAKLIFFWFKLSNAHRNFGTLSFILFTFKYFRWKFHPCPSF